MAGSFGAWVLANPGGELRYDACPVPELHRQGVLVRVESAMVLSYMRQVLDGTLGYALPPMPFVPGTNAVGRVEAVGPEVSHVAPGDRVFLSPHFVADMPVAEPPQILIGLTAMGVARAGGRSVDSRDLQHVWRNGTFAELAHWPASWVTRLPENGRTRPQSWITLAKLLVPYGGLLRGNVRSGQVVLINGATGYFGSAAVMIALAMGAARVVAIGRDRAALVISSPRLVLAWSRP